MKWFKHISDAHRSLKMKALLRSYGWEGYGIWWVMCEMVSREGKSEDNWCLPSVKEWRQELLSVTGVDYRWLNRFLSKCAFLHLIDEKQLKQGNLCIPQMKEYCDDYTERRNRVRTVSEHNTDSVPLEEKRRDKKRKEEKRINLFYKNLPIRKKDGKLWVIHGQGDWREYCGKLEDLEER